MRTGAFARRCGALGAAAGGVNAALCYLRLPAPVDGNPAFGWHLIPAGAFHGAGLAIMGLTIGRAMSKRPVMARLALAPGDRRAVVRDGLQEQGGVSPHDLVRVRCPSVMRT